MKMRRAKGFKRIDVNLLRIPVRNTTVIEEQTACSYCAICARKKPAVKGMESVTLRISGPLQ